MKKAGRAVNVHDAGLSIASWRTIIEDAYRGAKPGAIFNVDWRDGTHFDAIFIGGGSAGRFGEAVLRSLDGRPLAVERWPFLGGYGCRQPCHGP